jgi:hypothetical protein
MPSSSSSTIATLLAIAAGPLSLLHSAHADRDDSYYKPGRGNPNTYAEKMYWNDGSNVLEDLGSFSALYVEFHHCAWTQMKYDGDGDDESVDESDYWYLGSVPPFGANVAFSLYGALAGESFSGCGEDTFINSFYTDYGFETFSNAMYYAGQNGFSYSGNDDDGSGYSSSCGGGYGVGCDFENGFAVHSYSTNDCNPAYFSGVSDKMQSLNGYMENAQCIQIYDSSNYGGYYSGTSLELLAYSSACFYQNYWSPDGECPDPYGKLAEYQKNFSEGVQKSNEQETFTSYKEEHQKAETMWTFGSIAFAAAAVLVFSKVGPKRIRKMRGNRKMLPPTKPMLASDDASVSSQSILT